MLKYLLDSGRYIISSRLYSTAWTEVRIPVPWGYVAGKWWGPQDQRPVLATHGWLDNSGTFDTLIPLLPRTTSFLAIDFPGCGYSSKLPSGLFYHHIDTIVLIRRIIKYFNWQKVALLGHSMGAMMNYLYTMFYPEEVEFLICLDAFSPFTHGTELSEHIQEDITRFLKYDSINSIKEEPPSYFNEEIVQKLHGGFQYVALDKSDIILKRNTQSSSSNPNKVYFTMDPRLKTVGLLRWSEDNIIANAHRFTCPILVTKTDEGPLFQIDGYADKVIDIVKKNNTYFEFHSYKGAHHLHLNSPEGIANVINKFLKKFYIGDKSQNNLKEENLVVL